MRDRENLNKRSEQLCKAEAGVGVAALRGAGNVRRLQSLAEVETATQGRKRSPGLIRRLFSFAGRQRRR